MDNKNTAPVESSEADKSPNTRMATYDGVVTPNEEEMRRLQDEAEAHDQISSAETIDPGDYL